MRKIFLLGLVAAAVVAFVGVDVVRGAVGRAREAVRSSLTAEVPLKQQLAEARAQVDAYAESVIRGEVAAENLADSIVRVEREVVTLTTRLDRDRTALVTARRDLEAVPASTAGNAASERAGLAKARAFRSLNEVLERRTKDLERLKAEHAATVKSVTDAKAEQVRLVEEIRVLAAEIESLEARTAAARTREAVGASMVSSSGYAKAQERLQAIRDTVKERNKLLQYYEFERDATALAGEYALDETPANAADAIDEVLAAHPAR